MKSPFVFYCSLQRQRACGFRPRKPLLRRQELPAVALGQQRGLIVRLGLRGSRCAIGSGVGQRDLGCGTSESQRLQSTSITSNIATASLRQHTFCPGTSGNKIAQAEDTDCCDSRAASSPADRAHVSHAAAPAGLRMRSSSDRVAGTWIAVASEPCAFACSAASSRNAGAAVSYAPSDIGQQ